VAAPRTGSVGDYRGQVGKEIRNKASPPLRGPGQVEPESASEKE